MKKSVAILYADSRFTPWKENIDFSTLKTYYDALSGDYEVTVVHITEPNSELAEFLKEFDFVFNLCYGFGNYNQAEVAFWLDVHEVNHLTTSGKIQEIAQDKLLVEDFCIEQNIPVARSIRHVSKLDLNAKFIITKPRYGGCHRGITILENTNENKKIILDSILNKDFLVQEYIEGREFSVAVIPDESGNYTALNPAEFSPVPHRSIYVAGNSFGYTERNLDTDLDLSTVKYMKQISVQLHNMLGLKYMSRIDFRVKDNVPYVLDVNTMPNMHPEKSLLPAILEHDGISLKQLLQRKIQLNLEEQLVDESFYDRLLTGIIE